MKKWLFFLLVVPALIAGLLLFGLFALGSIINTAMNSVGSKITGTDLHVESVSLMIEKGIITMEEFFDKLKTVQAEYQVK